MGTILGHSQIGAHHLNKKNEYEMGHQPKKIAILLNMMIYTLLYTDFQVDFNSNLPIILLKWDRCNPK